MPVFSREIPYERQTDTVRIAFLQKCCYSTGLNKLAVASGQMLFFFAISQMA